jgi:hypothetical protein
MLIGEDVAQRALEFAPFEELMRTQWIPPEPGRVLRPIDGAARCGS